LPAISIDFEPLILTIAMAPLPAAVDIAQIVSEKSIYLNFAQR